MFIDLTSGSATDNAVAIDTNTANDVVDVVLHDTEVVHYADYVENSETDLMYGDDTEVVPDSDDDDIVDTNVVPDSDDDIVDTDYGRGSLGRRMSFIERLAADLSKVESHTQPICNKLDQPNVDIHDRSDQGHTSYMIACQGNEVTPIVVHSNMQATDLSSEDAKIFVEEDPHPNNVISCDLNFTKDGKQMSVECKVEKNDRPRQSKTRDVHAVYTRRKNVISKLKDYEMKDVNRSTEDYNDNRGLSYVESQEPEDLSTALLFVDQYISVNAIPMSSSPAKPVKTKQNSPLSLSAKGAQSVLRWAGANRSVDKVEIFEWNDSIDGVEKCIPSVNCGQPKLALRSKKYNRTYVRRSPSVMNSVRNEHAHKKEFREYSEIEEFPLRTTDINAIPEDSEHVFDVGIDTQIAAEAMQALSSVVCTDGSDMVPDQCPQKLPEKSGEDTQKQLCAEFWSFPKKIRSAHRDISGPKNRRRVNCSDILDDMQTSKQLDRRNSGKLASAKCVVGRTFTDSKKVNLTKKAKACRAKDDYNCKENFNESLSADDVPLCRPNNRRKVKNIRRASANLKSSSLFNMQEGLASEPMGNRVAVMKSGLYNRRKGRGIMHDVLDISAEKADRSNDLSDSSLTTRGMKLIDKDRTMEDDCAECNLLGSISWCLGDFPRGKRTHRSIQNHSEDYSDLDNSSVKLSVYKHNHSPLRCQSKRDSCPGSAASHSGIKRKRRSTIYISPCLLSSMKPESTTTGQVSNVDYTGCKANDNLKSHYPVFSSCQVSPGTPSEVNLTNLVDGHDKKKPSTTALTRELLRLGFTESIPDFTSKISRRRKTMANIQVLLSQNLDRSIRKHQLKILMRFGVPTASCPSDATHFVTDRFARTRNMLEFIAQGKPVVTHRWLESCDQAGFYIDDKDYIVRDAKKERELGFKLPISLDQAKHHPLLRGYRVLITPNAKPGKEMLASLVKASHGEVVNEIMDSKLDDLLILSCDEDQAYCIPFTQKGTAAYDPELLLNGIVIQKLEFARHRLFNAQVKG
ncbi:uncharacterized protein LOC141598351 isoform X2 [Silene latifolia]|uniref:uncharacterized protein LOC141598351 isoform X2 n=1 Tax=Silene latifolia TaxID=37657 RepID=UPI003D76F56E